MATQVIAGIHLPASDTHFRKHLELNPLVEGKGTYQFKKIEMALASAHRRVLALDIGAHVGLWSRILSLNFERVIAFEPVPDHIECFKLNLADCPNVRLEEVALGDQNGQIRISQTDDNTGAAHVSEAGQRVEVRMLDNYIAEWGDRVDFIKIDCEGFEEFVLRGGENLIRRDRPVMAVEQKTREERYGLARMGAVDLLKSWGAHIVWKKSGDFGLAWD